MGLGPGYQLRCACFWNLLDDNLRHEARQKANEKPTHYEALLPAADVPGWANHWKLHLHLELDPRPDREVHQLLLPGLSARHSDVRQPGHRSAELRMDGLHTARYVSSTLPSEST